MNYWRSWLGHDLAIAGESSEVGIDERNAERGKNQRRETKSEEKD